MSAKRNKNRAEKRSERAESIRAYFVRLFGKYDFRNEEHFAYFGKWLCFIVLLLVEALVVLQRIDGFYDKGGWGSFFILLGILSTLSVSMAVQLFAVKRFRRKVYFYAIDIVAALASLFFVGGVYSLIIYLIVLTQVYFEAESTKRAFGILGISVLLYVVVYGVQNYLLKSGAEWKLLQLFSLTFGFAVGIVTHFLAVQITLAFYRQYLKLHKALEELGESKKELEKAYAVVAEVSALEERQRIAKEIHDTVGHSLTTVIMQTETAKRMIGSNPKEAEVKLVSANLRARQALDEIRDGVHLLSGSSAGKTLQGALTDIIHECADGTGIKFRFSISDTQVSPAKHRFLCNTLKEGISNGLRHGGATAFWFELKEEEGRLLFLLSDNGRGVKQEKMQLGFGLTTMQDRARALGGEIAFFSDEEDGFEVRLTLPNDYKEGEYEY